MSVQTVVNQPNTKTSTASIRSRAPTHTRVTNKMAKPALERSAPSPKSTSPVIRKPVSTKIAVTQVTMLDKASNKQAVLIELMQRSDGVSLTEVMNLSGWQAHSVRGWISGTLRKKLGLVVSRFKSESGDTCYRIQSESVTSAARVVS